MQVCKDLKCSRSAAAAAEALEEAQDAWRCWAVGVHWLLQAAEAAGLQAIGGSTGQLGAAM